MDESRLCRPSWIFLLLALATVAATLAFVLRYSVNLPYWDEWEIVRLLEIAHRGELRAGDILALHNEHRIPIPRLIMMGLAWATAYNTIAQSLFTVSHLTVLLGYVYVAARRTCGFALGSAPVWFVLVAWLLMSWRQAENLLWGFQIGLTLPLTFGFIALFHLQSALLTDRRRMLHISIAALAGFSASFSSAMGLLIWPSGLLVALLHWHDGRIARRCAAIWAGIGVMAWLLYFVGYESPSHHASVTSALLQPLQLIQFFLTTCGAWAVGSSKAAVIGSVVLIALALCVCDLKGRRALVTHAVWLGMIFFCLGTLAIIAAGRSGFMPIAYRSGYTTYSLPIVAGLVVLLANVAKRRREPRMQRLIAATMLAIAFGTFNGYSVGADIAKSDRRSKAVLSSMLVDYRNRSDSELSVLYGHSEKVRAGAAFLAARHWSVFAHKAAVPRRLGPTHYNWGDRLRLGIGGNARPYLGEGWSVDEQGFVWGVGKSAFITMQVEDQPGPLRLELTYAMTLVVEGRIESQRVLVLINGEGIGQFAATGDGHVVVDLSATEVSAGELELEFQFPDALAPASLGVGEERRILSVAVSSLRLTDER